MENHSDIPQDPSAAAAEAGLHYVPDIGPGIRRRRRGKGFAYLQPNGRPVKDGKDLQRIRALAIPPAWTDVWICPDPKGHLQATGRDKRGRKQYRYHPQWRSIRDETKFSRMVAFGEALPAIRARIEADMAKAGLPREKVLAAVLRLLETGHLRVGNPEYAKANDSYGATTLKDDHAEISGATLKLEFRAKSGKVQKITLRDRRLARIVKRCQDLPGQELFQYVGEDGERHSIGSDQVNDYLREIAGEGFTAKDFRTWTATVMAACALGALDQVETKKEAKAHLKRAIEAAADELGNTPTVCRKSYIHPAVIMHYEESHCLSLPEAEPVEGLSQEEARVLAFLRGLVSADGG
ncbi:DNA topoisomerase IB [Telmatospirillum sp. J64-1]|uniref:DNA topoisomerase IB n=1 Tax=Telmatospirillum sp. J64-1 TaxID=2502183 RepID=UPI001C8F43BB|nr:DNA topoisomerase IB [Telmatospirillum sp. J64-1]